MSRLGRNAVHPRGSWMYGTWGVGARAAAVAVGAVLLLAGCSSSGGGETKDGAGGRATQQPKVSDPFWVDPDGNAARQVAAYEKAGKKAEADRIRKIAEQP